MEIPNELTTGRLKKFGYLIIKYNGVKLLTERPITKTVFENFVILQMDEAKALVIRAASYMPGLRLVEWDVVITESGPILVEGNSDYSIPVSDLAYGGYRTNPVFQKRLKKSTIYKQTTTRSGLLKKE